MPTLTLPLLSRLTSRLGPSTAGWVGIDVGRRAVKLAQVAWNGDTCHIERRWVLPTRDPSANEASEARPATHFALPSHLHIARKLFQGRAAAVVLPMADLNQRTIEVPPGTSAETANMIEQDLLADLSGCEEGVSFDFWESTVREQRGSDSKRVSILAAPRKDVVSFADKLLAAGFECRILDGMPCAMARAVALAEARDSDEPAAAIDLGHSHPLFVVAVRGRPVFTRSLRGCDLQSLYKPLCEGLSVEAAQAEQLLLRFGVCLGNGLVPKLSVEQATHRLVAAPLANLVTELQRTLAYLSQQFREFVPRRLWLLGGGATFPGIDGHLTRQLDTAAAPWRLLDAGTSAAPGDALFGVAVALSMLSRKEQP